MKNLFLAVVLLTSTAYRQTPVNAVKKCVISIDFFDTTSLVKKSTRLSEIQYYDQAGRLLEEKDIGRSGGLFSGIKYHYSDSLCIQKEYVGNSTINRNELFLYKNGKMMTSLRIEDGELQVITDYVYNENGLETSVARREYENGILKSENASHYCYDKAGRNIQTIVQNNDDTSFIEFIHYDSVAVKPSAVGKKAVFTYVETFISFDSMQRKERKWSYYNGGSPLEQENVFNNQRQLISKKSLSNGRVEEEELFTWNTLGRVTRHEVTESEHKKVYTFKDKMPVAEETWYNGKLYSTVNYTYSAVSKKRH